MKRYYQVRCYTHRMQPLVPSPEQVKSAYSGRFTAAILFRRVYGRPARRLYRASSTETIAMDRRGNVIFLDQINDDQLPGFDPRTGRFPIVPVQQAA